MPRDFLSEENEPIDEPDKMEPRDFLGESEPNEENIGTSIASAPFRIGDDLYKGAFNAAKSIPSYFESAKTEVPGLLKVLAQHPFHAAAQALAGSQEAINSLAQLPKNLAHYGSDRLNLLPKGITNFIDKITPEDTTNAINSLFGNAQYPGENLLRGAIRNLPNLATAAKLGSTFNPLNLTASNIAKDILNSRNDMLKKYSGENGLYTNLFNEAREKGLGNVNYNPEKINADVIKKYANPKFTENLDKFLVNPDIQIAQSAQSDLKKFIKNMKKRTIVTESERESLDAAKEAQKHITDKMFEGHDDLKNKYDKITKGYKNEVIPYTANKNINAFLDNDLLPSELVSSLSKGKFAAKRGKHHPEISLRKKALYGGGALGAAALGKKIYDVMMGNDHSE